LANTLSHYLDNIRDNLRIDPSSKGEVISELETHIEDSVRELREAGLSEEEASENCLNLLGPTKLLARQIYEVYSQGTWKQALLASTPHLLFGLLFALNWWQYIGWLSIVLILVIGTAIYGWYHGKPAWLFSWLGCSLLPVVVAGLFLLYSPQGWSWLAVFLYVPLALWLLYSFTVRAIKIDWLYSSLMLLPVPIIASWFLVVGAEGKSLTSNLGHVRDFAPWIGLSFLALGIAAAIFIRLRRRWWKIAILIVPGALTLTMVVSLANGRLGLPTIIILALGMLGLFLTPPLLEYRIRRGKQRSAT